MKLTSEAVSTIFSDCLFTNEELDDALLMDQAIIVEGITHTCGFHPKRTKSHEGDIIALLGQLPDVFVKSKGGGSTFLHLCEDRSGEIWTGLHKVMQELVLLGIAIGRVHYPIERQHWDALPGSMPYITVNI